MPSPLETIREKNSRTTAKPSGQSSIRSPSLFDGSELLADQGWNVSDQIATSVSHGPPAGRPARSPHPGDSCLPPVDRQGSEDGGCAGGEGQQTIGRRNPPAASLTDHHADRLPGVPASACPACGCPAVWMDGLGEQGDAGATLAARLHCGGCEPPPAMSLARKWFLAVKGEKGKSGGNGNGSGDGDGDGSRSSLWEEWRPMFNLAKRKKKGL